MTTVPQKHGRKEGQEDYSTSVAYNCVVQQMYSNLLAFFYAMFLYSMVVFLCFQPCLVLPTVYT